MDTSNFQIIKYPIASTLPSDMIKTKRASIRVNVLEKFPSRNPNSNQLPEMLDDLFKFYDQEFFGGELTRIIFRDRLQVSFIYNPRMTKTGGSCKKIGPLSYQINISSQVVLATFQNGEYSYSSNGLLCFDRLDCIMNIFEHELIHLAIFITHGHVKGDTIYKSHGLYFQKLVAASFGHTAFKHCLLSKIEKAGCREDFEVGDQVTYTGKAGEPLRGVITKMNKTNASIHHRAEIMHRVPYPMLRLSTPDEITENLDVKKLNLFKVGDCVRYTVNGETITSKILKVNLVTYDVGRHLVHHRLATLASNEILNDEHVKTRENFKIGQEVRYETARGVIIHGKISKLNPTRAIIDKVSVPYYMLT